MPELSLVLARPLKDFASVEKAALPVSLARGADGAQIVVSRFGDPSWNFWPYVPQENVPDGRKRLNWDFKLPDGHRLTDPEHAQLLESCKDYIWSLLAMPIEGRKAPRPITLISKATTLMHLVRWMVQQGFTRFSQLDGRSSEYIPVAKGNVSADTIHDRLGHWEDLHAQRDKIADGLPSHPWPLETSYTLTYGTGSRDYRKPKTEVIPDEVLKPLAKRAIDYVTRLAPNILDARDAAEAAAIGAPIDSRGYARTAWWKAKAVSRFGYNGAEALQTDIFHLRTACYIVIAMFSGIRDSEMMSLGKGCVVPGRSKDSSIDILWLHGTLYRTGERPKKWLVPPIVQVAVQVMERFSQPYWRALEAEGDSLEVASGANEADAVKRREKVIRHQGKLFLGADTKSHGAVSVLSSENMNSRLKRFCEHFNIIGPDGARWPLASHQFRRTFAYNYAKSQMGDLLYLQEHFGHRSLDMTLLYGDGGLDGYDTDADLLTEIAKAKQNRQVEILENLVDTDAPLANGERWIGDWRRTVRTAKNRDELIAELSETISLTGTGHSWCAGSASGTGCGSLCIFEPAMCTECDWAIISQEHLPVWREIAKQQEVVMGLDDIGEPGKVRAKRILQKARQVVATLEGA